MDGIIDQEIMDEINAEQAGSEAADERADALSEDTGAEGGATGAEAGAPGADEAGELPELSPMPGDDAGGGAEGETSERAGGADEIPAAVLGLLGVSTQREAMERLTDIAVSRLVDDGAPESVARELVELRMRIGGAAGAFRARDEPEKVGDAGAAAGVKDAGNAGSAQGEDVSPRIRDMARQVQYIRERTSVN